ncbi:hypothetical protein B0919_03705 [Hymenobacter sp. CRA2]|nr:hypothetical protein B0919_03705 [Hymenobacter sp. CRA2]
MWLLVGWSPALRAAPADELPSRPKPFRFVNDQASLLSAADAQTLEKGLRQYAAKAGLQIVVVTVPSLGGRDVADYARQLGTAWGVGQRDKDNGLVLLIAAQEHQVSIQAGSGLRQQITPALTSSVISQQLAPSFKQGNYFAGLRAGLNKLMQAADPSGTARPEQPASASNDALSSSAAPATVDASSSALEAPGADPAETPFSPTAQPEPVSAPSPGFSIGGMLIGALLLGGAVWLITRLFRRRTTAPDPAPNFYPNQGGPGPGGYNQAGGYGRGPAGPAPDFYPNRGAGSGNGLGGVLLTGAAAAAGAYLGNRMASGHDHDSYANNVNPGDNANTPPLPTGQGGFPALGGAGGGYADQDDPTPDYFSDDATNSPDYFSDDSSYDDPSSDNTGGGGFDDDNSNSGSW